MTEERNRGQVYRALARDAYLQVVDNLVFRILLVLVLVFVFLTFAIAFKDDGIVFLFGVAKADYSEFLGVLQGFIGAVGGSDMSASVVEGFQSLFGEWIAGVFGAFFSIVATAFFVPRMLEKGSADTLFSKPLSRGTLVLTRYLASVLFVGILAGVLVGGMYLGFAFSSGYTDPKFLWSAPMLVYLFALLSAISTFFGALTRSSVATLLLTLVCWMACWGVHGGWRVYEYFAESDFAVEQEEMPRGLQIFGSVLNTAHLILPKTSDAASLTELLRRRVSGEERRLVGGVETWREAMAAVYVQLDGTIVVRLGDGDELEFVGEAAQRIRVTANPSVLYLEYDRTDGLRVWVARYREDRNARRDAADRAEKEGLEEPVFDWPPSWTEVADVIPPDEVKMTARTPRAYFDEQFSWSQTNLAYNPWFSVGSSVLFCGLLVLLAIWRVRRIDF